MECNSFHGRDASYCKRARFADRHVRATRLGSVSGEWRPKCVLTMIPPSRAKDAQGWGSPRVGRASPPVRPSREQVRLLIVSPVCFIPERQLGTIPYT